jgi:hypothetical protein
MQFNAKVITLANFFTLYQMKNKISIIIIIFSLFISSVGLNAAQAEYRTADPANFAKEKTAVLFLSDLTQISDDKYKIKLMIDTGSQSVNALLASLNFSGEIINIEEINIEKSICDLFIENSFDNEQGVLNITCGKPYPGFNETAEVAEITFSTLAPQPFGTMEPTVAGFTFSDAMVLANDGYGTDILLGAKNSKIYFLKNKKLNL